MPGLRTDELDSIRTEFNLFLQDEAVITRPSEPTLSTTVICRISHKPVSTLRLEGFPFGVNITAIRIVFPDDTDLEAGDTVAVTGKGIYWCDRVDPNSTISASNSGVFACVRDGNGHLNLPENQTVHVISKIDPMLEWDLTGYLAPIEERVDSVYQHAFLVGWRFSWDTEVTYANGQLIGEGDRVSFVIAGVTHMNMVLENLRQTLTPVPFTSAEIQEAMNNIQLTFVQASDLNQSITINARGHEVSIPMPESGESEGTLLHQYWFWAMNSDLKYQNGNPVTSNDTVTSPGLGNLLIRSIVPDLARGIDSQIVVDSSSS